jgi:hypothetical protein
LIAVTFGFARAIVATVAGRRSTPVRDGTL